MADYVPALKAKMGDWDYYVTVMKLGKIARECRLAEEIHANKDLDALIQREIQDHYAYLDNIWMRMLNKCPGFEAVLKGKKKAGDIRKRMDDDAIIFDDGGKPIAGGNIFARPIGQFIIADVLKLVGVQGKSIEDAIDAIMTHIPMDVDKAPWVGVIWDSTTQRADSAKEGRGLIASMISHALGLKISTKIRDLKHKYRETLKDDKASLLEPIDWSGRPMHEHVEDDEEYIADS